MTTPPTASTLPSAAWAGPVMVLAGGVALGFAPIGLRLGLDELGPQAIAFWRYLFAIPMLLPLVFLIEKRAPRRPNVWVFIAAVCFTLDMALWHYALTLTSVSNATFIVNLGNLGTGLAAWALFKQRPSGTWMIAALIAFAGAAALSLGRHSASAGALRGDILALVAAVFVAGYMVFSKRSRDGLTGIEAMFWLTVFEAALALPIVMMAGESFWPHTAQGWLAPLALAMIVQVIGQGLIISGLGRTDAGLAGILVLAQPVVAAIISWFLFHEAMTSVQIAGAGAILAAVWLVQARAHRAAVSPAS